MAKEKTIMAFALNQTGIIIVRNMSSTDRLGQNRTMRKIAGITIMAKTAMAITTVTVTGNRSDENKEKQRP